MHSTNAPHLNRREFLLSTAATSLGVTQLASTADSSAKAASRSPIVDCHVHCFAGRNDARFPYHPRGPYQPEAAATPQHLLKAMSEGGIDYAIIVHPEPYQDDHRYLEYCLNVGKGRLRGTCLFFANQPASVAKMPELVKRLPIVAARIHAYAPDRLPPFGKPELREFWKTASDLGIAVQLHFEPRFAAGFEPLIKEFSSTTVIIDHLGRPFPGTPEDHERVVQWAKLKNTVMKLSAIPPQDTYPHRDIRPVIKRLVSEYGADRMIYGGGFSETVTGDSYRAAVERTRSFIAHLSAADEAKILGGNAGKLFGFKQRG
jgi:predicted TIM-barrel fold metal-dependent hydrolase